MRLIKGKSSRQSCPVVTWQPITDINNFFFFYQRAKGALLCDVVAADSDRDRGTGLHSPSRVDSPLSWPPATFASVPLSASDHNRLFSEGGFSM